MGDIMGLKKEFDRIFYTTPEIDRCNEKLWDWTVKKIGDEGAKLYDLGKEIGYNKAFDDAIRVAKRIELNNERPPIAGEIEYELEQLREKK